MFFHRHHDSASNLPARQATAFRENGGVALVVLVNLEFGRCAFRSSAKFEPGESLRVHLSGQGWIRMKVQSMSAELVWASFVTECSA